MPIKNTDFPITFPETDVDQKRDWFYEYVWQIQQGLIPLPPSGDTLQEVTTAGNTTTNDITLDGSDLTFTQGQGKFYGNSVFAFTVFGDTGGSTNGQWAGVVTNAGDTYEGQIYVDHYMPWSVTSLGSYGFIQELGADRVGAYIGSYYVFGRSGSKLVSFGHGDRVWDTAWVEEAYISADGQLNANTAKFGTLDGANTSEFESDGTLKFNGDAIVWDDQQVNLGTVGFGSSAPTWTAFKGGKVLAFDKAQDNEITFIIQFSHRLKTGTDVELHIHTSPADDTAGDVKWNITYSFADIDGTFPAPSSGTLTQTIAANSSDKHMYFSIYSQIATPTGVSGIVICTLTREGTHVDDDYDNDIYLLAIDSHMQIDTVGSRTETTK